MKTILKDYIKAFANWRLLLVIALGYAGFAIGTANIDGDACLFDIVRILAFAVLECVAFVLGHHWNREGYFEDYNRVMTDED